MRADGRGGRPGGPAPEDLPNPGARALPRSLPPLPPPLGRAPSAAARERFSTPVMILPQVHLRKPCYDFYFL